MKPTAAKAFTFNHTCITNYRTISIIISTLSTCVSFLYAYTIENLRRRRRLFSGLSVRELFSGIWRLQGFRDAQTDLDSLTDGQTRKQTAFGVEGSLFSGLSVREWVCESVHGSWSVCASRKPCERHQKTSPDFGHRCTWVRRYAD